MLMNKDNANDNANANANYYANTNDKAISNTNDYANANFNAKDDDNDNTQAKSNPHVMLMLFRKYLNLENIKTRLNLFKSGLIFVWLVLTTKIERPELQ